MTHFNISVAADKPRIQRILRLFCGMYILAEIKESKCLRSLLFAKEKRECLSNFHSNFFLRFINPPPPPQKKKKLMLLIFSVLKTLPKILNILFMRNHK